MKFKYEIVFQAIGDFYLAIPVGKTSGDCVSYIKINGSCYFIASRIDRGLSVEQIATEYMEEFGIDMDMAMRDVTYTIGSLREMGFVED